MRTRDEILAELTTVEKQESSLYDDYQRKLKTRGDGASETKIAKVAWESVKQHYTELLQELYKLGMENISAPDSFWVLDVPAYTGPLDTNSIQKEIDNASESITNLKMLLEAIYQSTLSRKYDKYLERPDAERFYEYVKALVKLENKQKEILTYEAYLEYLYTLLEGEKTSDKILSDAVEYYNEDIKDDGKNNGSADSKGKETNNLFVNHYKDIQKKEDKQKVNILQLLLFGGAFYFLMRE